ncbi:chemotaxis protein CheW [Scytonema hofmannii]|uniref:chemotaxis protein CheW n=1 Tax=Scytonema hofmannii TaxID=34078 RepID=UPI000345B2BA|nr:chemotaxis protein CheW [Scytonema hofmannii]
MLFLLLTIDNQLYAIASQQVVEVLPLVILKTLPHTPKYVAGVFNYRGRIVSVLDLCQLMRDRSVSYLNEELLFHTLSKKVMS